jgi:glycosyltransferase involved in cell wall biosynthesis
VLFLGQVVLRKGIVALLESAKLLESQPVEFCIVGSLGITIPSQVHRNIRRVGSISRSAVSQYYQWADVFLFPTLSDGFGLTQLEAQAWKLPIIASQFCGEVVRHQVNGIILEEVTGGAIAEALIFCLNHPQKLHQFSSQIGNLEGFNLAQLATNLQTLINKFT